VVSLLETADRSDDRLFYKGLGVVLLVALSLRALFLFTAYTHDIYWDLLLLDSQIYRETATRIAGGDWIAGSEAFTLGPLYPYVLGLLLWVFGEGHGVAYVFQQVLGLGSIAMTGLIGRHCFGSRAGIVAAALMALYAPLPMMELKIMASTLAVFLALSGTLLLMRAHARWSLPGCLWAGRMRRPSSSTSSTGVPSTSGPAGIWKKRLPSAGGNSRLSKICQFSLVTDRT